MFSLLLALLFGLAALMFFTAERSLSLFSWFRLEELDAPRLRKQVVGNCLRDRDLVVTTFLVAGCLAIAALAIALVAGAEIPILAGLQVIVLVLLLGWILPEIIAWRMGDRVVLYLAPLLYEFSGVPFRALRRTVRGPAAATGFFRGGAASSGAGGPDTALSAQREAERAQVQAQRVFRRAVRLRHIQVRDIMTPRTEMVTVADTATLREAARVSLDSGYSRLPVYHVSRDHIIGVLHAKDLLKFAAEKPSALKPDWDKPGLSSLARQPLFVPETKAVSDLLEELQRSSLHMGIVVDEYGGTRGVVTLEDVMEELIGEIRDEHESPQEQEALFKRLGDGSVEASATMRIEDFNNEFDVDFPKQEGFDTLGGLAAFVLGRIPAKDESFHAGGARVTVTEANLRRVLRVRVDFNRG